MVTTTCLLSKVSPVRFRGMQPKLKGTWQLNGGTQNIPSERFDSLNTGLYGNT